MSNFLKITLLLSGIITSFSAISETKLFTGDYHGYSNDQRSELYTKYYVYQGGYTKIYPEEGLRSPGWGWDPIQYGLNLQGSFWGADLNNDGSISDILDYYYSHYPGDLYEVMDLNLHAPYNFTNFDVDARPNENFFNISASFEDDSLGFEDYYSFYIFTSSGAGGRYYSYSSGYNSSAPGFISQYPFRSDGTIIVPVLPSIWFLGSALIGLLGITKFRQQI